MNLATAAIPAELAFPALKVEDAKTDNGLWQVFDACCDGLYRYVLFRVGGDRHAADDLLQQVCCLAAGHHRVPEQPEACEAWLRGIARNLIRKHWRDRARGNGASGPPNGRAGRRLLEEMEAGPLPEEVLAREETVRQLLWAVTALSAPDQRLIFAFYFEGRSQADIARDDGATVKGIENRLHRARNRLRAILQEPERTESA